MTTIQIENKITKLLKNFLQDNFIFEYLFKLYEEMIAKEGKDA